jgi:heme/copper-type cytochrome/quinol oxidase subunit 2
LNEFHRDSFYFSLKFFNYSVLKTFLSKSNDIINLNLLTDYLFLYFLDDASSYKTTQDVELYKSQYRPLKKGITNMIRLHATGAIAMPIEIRLQVLASSKDVIHSWAIPSAGIKIDCVPGYSSHKVMIFLVSGIF